MSIYDWMQRPAPQAVDQMGLPAGRDVSMTTGGPQNSGIQDYLAMLAKQGVPPTAQNMNRAREATARNTRGAPSGGGGAPSGNGGGGAVYGDDTFGDVGQPGTTSAPPSAPLPTVANSTMPSGGGASGDTFGQTGNPEIAAMVLGALGLGGAGLYGASRMRGGAPTAAPPMGVPGPMPPPVPLSAMNFTPPEVSPTGLAPGPRTPVLPPRVPGQMPQMQVPESSLQAGPRSDIATRALAGEPPVVDPLQSAMNKAVPTEPPPVPPSAPPQANPNAGKPPPPESTPRREGPPAKGPTESNARLRSAQPASDPARLAELAKQIWPNASTDELIALVRSVFKTTGKVAGKVR
jgi:hypothetical protein